MTVNNKNNYRKKYNDESVSINKLNNGYTKKITRNNNFFVPWFIGLCVVVIGYIAISGVLVKNIKISGNHSVSDKKIERSSRIKLNRFYLEFDKNKINQNINQSYKMIHLSEIKRDGLNTINLRVKDDSSNILGYLKQSNQYYELKKRGSKILFIKVSSVKETSKLKRTVFINFSKKISKNLLISYNRLPFTVKKEILKIKFQPSSIFPDRIHGFLADGNEFYARISTWDKKMKYYNQMLSKVNKRSVFHLEEGAYSYPFKN